MEQTQPVDNLAGQVVLVIDAGRGISRVLAQAFAQAGARVAITARFADQVTETAEQIRAAGGQYAAFLADGIDQPAIQRIVAQVTDQFGPIDLLITTAGIVGPVGPLWENDLDAWWYTLEVNLRGPVIGMQAVLPGMIARRRGRIINLSSPAAVGRFPEATAYPTSKAALTNLTYHVARSTQPYGVSVFALAPQFMRTSASEWLTPDPEVTRWFNLKRSFDAGLETPMERTVQWCLDIAAGKADLLAGRHIGEQEDLAELVRRADEIQQGDLYTLQLRTQADSTRDAG